jgi:RNA polymerase sigma-70 factor (ECF subfamily)
MAIDANFQRQTPTPADAAAPSQPPATTSRAHASTEDAACIDAVLKGDRQRYAELVQRYQRVVFAVVRGYVPDIHLAEDVAQDAFVSAFTSLSTLRDRQQFLPWLLQIARHQAARVGKKETGRLDREPLAVDPIQYEPPENNERQTLPQLEQLPEPYRTTLMQKYVQELSCKDIAEHEGVKIGTITSRLARGLEMLRIALKK